MKTHPFFISVFVFLSVYIYGCSNHYNTDDRYQYYLKDIDTTTFEKYNLISFTGLKSGRFYVLSRKCTLLKTEEDYKVSKLEIGKKYSLHLSHIDTTIVAELHFIPTRQIEVYFNDSTIIWQQDTFRTNIFMTEEIKGLYLLRNR